MSRSLEHTAGKILLEAKTSAEKEESKEVRKHLSQLSSAQLHYDSDNNHFVGYTGQSYKTIHNQLLKAGYSHDPDDDSDGLSKQYHKSTKQFHHTVTVEPKGSNLTHIRVEHFGQNSIDENLDSTKINLIGRSVIYTGPTTPPFKSGEALIVTGQHPSGAYQVKKKKSYKKYYIKPKEFKLIEQVDYHRDDEVCTSSSTNKRAKAILILTKNKTEA